MKLRKQTAIKTHSVTKRSVQLISENGDYCQEKYGFKWHNGMLVSGVGYTVDKSILNVPEGIKSAYYSLATDSLFVATAQGIFVNCPSLNLNFTKLINKFSEGHFYVETFLNDKYTALVYSENDYVAIDGQSFVSSQNKKIFGCGTIHCGRLFACEESDSKKLWWSGWTPNDWQSGINGCGYVHLPTDGGEVLKLFSYDEKLICVRQNGITIVRAYGEPQHYKVEASAIYLTADGIVKDTCAMCNGELFFCTESGIFSFDGSDIERQENAFEWDICGYQSAVAYGDKYYIICDSKTHGKGVLFVYEPTNKTGYYVDIYPECLAVTNGIVAFKNGKAYNINSSGNGKWISRQINFSTNAPKLLKQVELQCDGDFSLLIESGKIKRTVDGRGIIPLKMQGINFKFTIEGCGAIQSFSALAEVKDDI